MCRGTRTGDKRSTRLKRGRLRGRLGQAERQRTQEAEQKRYMAPER